MKDGLFLTFEGGEGAGKTTLLEAVFHQLRKEGYQVIKTREPGGTSLGEAIRSLLLHRKGPISLYAELSLFLASRAQQISEVILPALGAGNIVLCDRFNDSTIVYQGMGRSLGMEKVASVCHFISSGLEPHLTLYLDLDPKVGLLRVQKNRSKDRIEAEELSFHIKIREGYLAIHRQYPDRVRMLDAAQAPEEVFHRAMQWIHSLLS